MKHGIFGHPHIKWLIFESMCYDVYEIYIYIYIYNKIKYTHILYLVLLLRYFVIDYKLSLFYR